MFGRWFNKHIFGSKLGNLASKLDVKRVTWNLVVFVDGDGSIGSLFYMNELLSRIPRLQSRIHVIAAVNNKHDSKLGESLSKVDWCTFIYSKTNYKDAADTILTTHMASLNVLLETDIPFIVITNDHFPKEAVNVMSRYDNRKILVLKHHEVEYLDEIIGEL